MTRRCRRVLAALWILMLGSGAGCAGAGLARQDDPVKRLEARVAEYWEARIRGDLVKTYMLYEPGFRRVVTLTGFLQGRGAAPVFDYAVTKTEMKDDLGIVAVKVRATVVHPALVKPVEPRWKEIEEQWVRIDGEWYKKFRFPTGDPYRTVDWDAIAEEGRSGEQQR